MLYQQMIFEYKDGGCLCQVPAEEFCNLSWLEKFAIIDDNPHLDESTGLRKAF